MPGREVKIVPVHAQDIAAVARLEREIFPDSWSERSLEDTLRQPHSVMLGAWIRGELTGYLILYYVTPEAEIARIAVAKEARRQGVAGKLLEGTREFCEEQGIEKFLLDVSESNTGAIAFYKKHGFKEDGIRKKFYTNPVENAILMSRGKLL